jgi:tetratricopeptide (TPR) repeat protein
MAELAMEFSAVKVRTTREPDDRERDRGPGPAEGTPGGAAAAVVPAETAGPLLAGGARALSGDGDLRTSRQWFEKAYQAAERSGDTQVMAAAALGLSGLWVQEHRTAAAAALLEARLRLALSQADPPSSLALRLRIRLAGESDYRSGEHGAILAVLDEATRAADPTARAQALSLAHHCLLGPGYGGLRRELAADLMGESSRTACRGDLLMGLLWQTVDMFLDGEPHAERRLGELRDLLAERDHLAAGFVVSAIEVMLTIRAGQLNQAEVAASTCAERGSAAGDVDATGWHGGHLVAIRWYQGRLAELLPMLDDLVHSPTLSSVDNSYFAALAVAAALAGDRRKAAGALATLRGRDLADLPRSSSWLVTMNGIVEAAHLLGDVATSARAYELLSPFAHLPMMAGLSIVCFGSAEHALGVAALTMGDPDRAVAHLRAAIERNLALAHWPAVMTSRVRYAQSLVLRGQPQDAAEARQQLAIAAQEAAALGIAVPDGLTPLPPEPAVASCIRLGRCWQVQWGSRTVLVEHSIGLLHLAVLVTNPGQEIPAIELAAGITALAQARAAAGVSAQPVLDQVAAREYRSRLTRLHAEIGELEFTNDPDRVAIARAERDWLTAELAGATAIAGRARRFPDNSERARVAAGKAIRRALARIEEADAVIGEHLRATVHTGVRCSYRPRPRI